MLSFEEKTKAKPHAFVEEVDAKNSKFLFDTPPTPYTFFC